MSSSVDMVMASWEDTTARSLQGTRVAQGHCYCLLTLQLDSAEPIACGTSPAHSIVLFTGGVHHSTLSTQTTHEVDMNIGGPR